ncbi:hypothetical protein HDF22_004736 [Mucilaginibacter lappiensis]|uniref:Uncharacterized protein n=1 Tax=Mucilaginibacter lappiensis TaxID=354630 RepID=A0A841JHE6_9SPHI|nr:hypothetical protein [Mucilaginibacter lappiensis]
MDLYIVTYLKHDCLSNKEYFWRYKNDEVIMVDM